MSPFDWEEGQHIPGIIVNPGTGPVHGATQENAERNVHAFLVDLVMRFEEATDDGYVIECKGEYQEATDFDPETRKFKESFQGRYTFTVKHGEREIEIDMPGLPTDEVRWIKGQTTRSIFDFPRMYINGSSWIWDIGLSIANSALFGKEDDE